MPAAPRTDATELIGRQVTKSGAELTYHVFNQPNENAALAVLFAAAPVQFGGFALTDWRLGDSLNRYNFKITVIYGEGAVEKADRTAPETGESEFSFSIAVQPVRVFIPPQGGSITVYGPPAVPEEGYPTVQLIGETGEPEESAEGVEIFEPTYDFSERHFIAADIVDSDYIATLKSLVGKVNNAPFKGHAAGEVLAVGVEGTQRKARADWELSFSWKVRENQTDIVVGDVTYSKQGWQYVWPMAARKVVVKRNYFERVISFICVSDVYRKADFAAFGLDEPEE